MNSILVIFILESLYKADAKTEFSIQYDDIHKRFDWKGVSRYSWKKILQANLNDHQGVIVITKVGNGSFSVTFCFGRCKYTNTKDAWGLTHFSFLRCWNDDDERLSPFNQKSRNVLKGRDKEHGNFFNQFPIFENWQIWEVQTMRPEIP